MESSSRRSSSRDGRGIVHRVRTPLLKLIGPLLLLGTWELLSRTGVLHRVYFPPPTKVISRLPILFDADDGLGSDLQATVIRLLIVIAFCVIGGVAVGLVITTARWIGRGANVLLAFLYPIPGLLFFPFLTFQLGRGEAAIIVTASVTPFTVMVFYTAAGIHSIKPVLLEVADNYMSSGVKRFLRVLLPGALPTIITGIRIALGFSLIAVIAVEMVGASEGLGFFLWQSWRILRQTDMYVALLFIAALGVLCSTGFEALANKLVPWREEATKP